MASPSARTTMWCLEVLIAAFILAPVATRAADSVPAAAFVSLQLRDGRVLHNARVTGDEGDSIVIRADEGLFKVEKDALPAALAASYPTPTPTVATEQMVMVPFNLNPPDAAPEPEPRPKPNPANVPNPVQSSSLAFKGCTIVSFQMKAFQNLQGCAEVVISNSTDAPVVVLPRNLVCATPSGARHAGRFFVTDGFPPIIRRREVVPAQGSIDEEIIFTNDAIEISSV